MSEQIEIGLTFHSTFSEAEHFQLVYLELMCCHDEQVAQRPARIFSVSGIAESNEYIRAHPTGLVLFTDTKVLLQWINGDIFCFC